MYMNNFVIIGRDIFINNSICNKSMHIGRPFAIECRTEVSRKLRIKIAIIIPMIFLFLKDVSIINVVRFSNYSIFSRILYKDIRISFNLSNSFEIAEIKSLKLLIVR